MANSEDKTKTPHTPGSQPSTHPGSGEPQTITAPTPPVAQTTGPPKPGDLADEGDGAEQSRAEGESETTSEDD
jgi:hypothetical protein